jgi:3D (Asp-Asp-Asp) domain-containing protein
LHRWRALGRRAAAGAVERPTQARMESPDAYTTPALLRHGGATEIVLTGGDVVTGHDPESGRELWRADARRIIAADPRVLPLGSVVRIDGLDARHNGTYTVSDPGSAIQGHRICTHARYAGRESEQATGIGPSPVQSP